MTEVIKYPDPVSRTSTVTELPVHDWRAGLAQKRGGDYKQHVANIKAALELAPELQGRFALNTLSDQIEVVNDLPWRDEGHCGELMEFDIIELVAWLNEQGLEPSKETTFDAIVAVARRNSFNPLQDYLQQVGARWDGNQRLDTDLLIWFTVKPTVFARAAIKRFMISAVARAMTPGCKVDTMLVLEGGQGAGKSTALSMLASFPYFLDSMAKLSKGKEAQEQLRGKWIIEMAELDALGMRERTAVKAFLSQRSDNYRAPYAKLSKDYPRSAIFAGTTNETQWLNDPTGGRRFWPVKVEGQIKIGMIEEYRDQLWAEAYTAWEAGEQWHLTDDEEAAAKVEQEKRRSADELEEPILHYITEYKLVEVGKAWLLEHLAEVHGRSLTQNSSTGSRIRDVFATIPGDWKHIDRKQMPNPKYGGPHKSKRTETWTCTDPEIRAKIVAGNGIDF
jgi:predicted P-loop ATPase